jgi:hypothetical protein
VLFHHCSASRIFIMQPGCSPPPVVTQKDDYQPCSGEKQVGLQPPSCPQLQGCSSFLLGRRASRVGAPPFALAGGPLLPPAFGGEGRSPALRRRRTSATRGRSSEAPSAATCLAPWLGWPWGRLRRCLLPLGRGVAVRPPHGRRSRRARVCHIHGFSRAAGRTGGRTRRHTPRGSQRRSWMVLSSLHGRTGARTSSHALRQPPSTGAEVATVVGVEVVAAAGEAAPCRGGCLRLRRSLLLASRSEQRSSSLLVQRWSLPSVGLSGASFQRDSCWCSVVHSCRNGARVPLVRECSDICLRAECNNICTHDYSLGSQVMCSDSLDGGFKY